MKPVQIQVLIIMNNYVRFVNKNGNLTLFLTFFF